MIEGEIAMTAREELHKLIDVLPEEQIAELRLYVEDLQSDGEEEELDAGTLAAIREGLDDIAHGRVMDVEEYRRTRGL
jgi:predicted transcriptional regulator